ncbi:MAG: PCMD domain-containing protein [Prevotellaceae bacterium]|nr:PCMD domain-containing protein [Prevotellaceae bacterium]
MSRFNSTKSAKARKREVVFPYFPSCLRAFALSCCCTLFLLPSCIQDELPNTEADILACTIPDMPKDALNEIVVENNAVKIWVKPDVRIGTLTPRFVLTEGATITPPSGMPDNFEETSEHFYTVTSQDGKWQKKYTVAVLSYILTQTEFHFEHYEKAIETANFQQFYELNGEEKQYVWSSGNRGFAIVNSSVAAENYPTSSYANGKTGRGVKLTTTSTGTAGNLVGMPIAAGNLFIGSFDVSKAMTATLEATQFGFQCKVGEPDSLKFWYKYRRGAVYKDKNGNELQKEDSPSMYSVLYEPVRKPDGTLERLNGTNVTTAGNILAIAQVNQADIVYSENLETEEYRQLSIPFVEKKAIDPEKLRNGSYFLTIVFSSSAKGDLFEGAVGSTLCIDEVQLIRK